VHNNGHRGSGSRAKAGAWLTPQQHAAALSLALEWRQRWRDEARDRGNGAPEGSAAKPPGRPRTSTNDRAAFAAGIARAEFGRFYWDAKKHRFAGTKHKPRPAK
jgi:hypothetical protein